MSEREPPHRLKPLPFDARALEPAIGAETVRWHHGVHQKGYVDKRNEIERKLAELDASKAHASYSEWGELKRKESFNASGQILHEIYWEALGGAGGAPRGPLLEAIERDFGGFDKWRDDFSATAKAAFGWAVLAWDPSDGRLHDYLVDFHHHGGVWGATPLLAIDVWEHAYYRDRGPDKSAYVAAFLGSVNWRAVESRWDRHVEPLRRSLFR